jgi:hypothetical protein
MNESQPGARPSKRYGVRMLVALGVAWLAAILGWFLLLVAPNLIPNCTVGGKATSTQCGALTPVIDGAIEAYFIIGTILYAATIPWLVAGIVVTVIESRRAKASA